MFALIGFVKPSNCLSSENSSPFPYLLQLSICLFACKSNRDRTNFARIFSLVLYFGIFRQFFFLLLPPLGKLRALKPDVTSAGQLTTSLWRAGVFRVHFRAYMNLNTHIHIYLCICVSVCLKYVWLSIAMWHMVHIILLGICSASCVMCSYLLFLYCMQVLLCCVQRNADFFILFFIIIFVLFFVA